MNVQLETIRCHVFLYDVDDVFNIVTPVDLSSNKLTGEVRNLFQDFRTLHVTQVANSNAWWNRYAEEDYVRENMMYTHTLLRNNSSEDLWNRCSDEYDEFHLEQKGGPLMLHIILKRITDSSETAINHVKSQFELMKISAIQGEDVEEVITLIKSLNSLLMGASTPERNYVPDDFSKTVLEVLQTTSVKKFNDIFYDEMEKCRREADKAGGVTQWPTIGEITTLATASYSRLKTEWNVSGKCALTTTTGTTSRSKEWKCWNCDKNCGAKSPKECKSKPIDHEKIARNRESFLKAKRQCQQNRTNDQEGSSRPARKTIDRKHMILNKKGAYVLDQATVHKNKLKDDLKTEEKNLQTQKDQLVKQINEMKSNLAAQESSRSDQQISESISRLDKIRAALGSL